MVKTRKCADCRYNFYKFECKSCIKKDRFEYKTDHIIIDRIEITKPQLENLRSIILKYSNINNFACYEKKGVLYVKIIILRDYDAYLNVISRFCYYNSAKHLTEYEFNDNISILDRKDKIIINA